ncbi:MAG: hypothetical protein ACRDLK_02940 [Gaiellaceae bacterium]
MSIRRTGAVAGVAVVALVALAFVGRWERGRNASSQNGQMRAVFDVATSRGLDSRLLDEYRLDFAFDCLLYHPAGRPADVAAYELCFDRRGRLVETIDRHTGTPRFASLHEQPALSDLRIPVPRLMAILAARGAPQADPRLASVSADASTLPLASGDEGAFRFPKPPPTP